MRTASPRPALLRSCAGTSAADQVNHARHTHAPMHPPSTSNRAIATPFLGCTQVPTRRLPPFPSRKWAKTSNSEPAQITKNQEYSCRERPDGPQKVRPCSTHPVRAAASRPPGVSAGESPHATHLALPSLCACSRARHRPSTLHSAALTCRDAPGSFQVVYRCNLDAQRGRCRPSPAHGGVFWAACIFGPGQRRWTGGSPSKY